MSRGRRLADDEGGAFPVFEAVIVAVLILTTIIFFTSLQRPTAATDAGGIDLGRLAADTLQVVKTREFTATGAACDANVVDATLDEWVNRSLTPHSATDTCMSDAVEEFLDEVLPPGTRFQVRLDNGVEPLVLVPAQDAEEPRAGHAAEIYIDPGWRTNRGSVAINATVNPQTLPPGAQIPAAYSTATSFTSNAAIKCIEAPNGAARAPDGTPWATLWQDSTSWAGGASAPEVPATAMYGVWTGHAVAGFAGGPTDYGCSGAVTGRVRVGLPAGFVAFTADDAANTLQAASHGLAAGTPVEFSTSGTLPAPLAGGTTYYVVNPAAGTFQVATTVGGSAIDLTSAGTGSHTFLDNPRASQSDWAVYGLQLVVWFGA